MELNKNILLKYLSYKKILILCFNIIMTLELNSNFKLGVISCMVSRGVGGHHQEKDFISQKSCIIPLYKNTVLLISISHKIQHWKLGLLETPFTSTSLHTLIEITDTSLLGKLCLFLYNSFKTAKKISWTYCLFCLSTFPFNVFLTVKISFNTILYSHLVYSILSS